MTESAHGQLIVMKTQPSNSSRSNTNFADDQGNTANVNETSITTAGGDVKPSTNGGDPKMNAISMSLMSSDCSGVVGADYEIPMQNWNNQLRQRVAAVFRPATKCKRV